MAGPWDNYSTTSPAPSPVSSSGPWESYKPDSGAAEQAAAEWRARTGAAPDVPTPFDAGLSQSIPQPSAADRVEQFSGAAGDALTAGLIKAKTGTELAMAGLPVLAGDQRLSDYIFGGVQQQNEEADRLAAQASGANKAGAVTGNVLSFLPYVLGGEASLPARATELTGLLPRAAAGAARALPTAAAIGTQQATQQALGVANQGGSAAEAEKAYLTALPTDTAVNLLPAGVPGSLPLRAASGAALAGGGQTAAQEIQHQVSPKYVQAPTAEDVSQGGMLGAIMGAAFGHGATPEALHMDESLRRYQESTATPPGSTQAPRALPAPANESPPVAAPPTPSGEPKAATSTPPSSPRDAFLSDPAGALNALDHATVKQIAEDAGFEVKPEDTKPSIIRKIVGQGRPYLESDVLPEYLANLPGKPAATEPMPQAPTRAAQEPAARTIPPDVTIPVDRTGTAYTPEQGAQTFLAAMDEARGNERGLAAPVTTVDRAGNAVDSAAFSRALDEARNQAQNKLDLGMTPDIERAQTQHPGMPADEMVGEHDLTPTDPEYAGKQPWWVAGQFADADHQAAVAALKKNNPEAPAPLSPATPVDTSHDVTLGGGVAKDNSRIYIDRGIPQFIDVPKEDGSGMARVNAWEDIAGHEAAEKPELDQGTHYYDAHEQNANHYEDGFLQSKYGVTRAAVDKVLQPYLDAAAAKNPESANIPSDLDRKPYEDGGDTAMLPEASNELAKLNIPEELHPQAMQFLAHVERALDAGIPAEHLRGIASSNTDLPAKLTQIDQLIGETGHAHATTGDTQAEGVPRETATAPLREAGETGEPAAQQGAAEAGHAEAQGQQQPAVSDRSDQLAEGTGESGGVPVAMRRADWNQQTEGRAITELDSLVQRYGGSTLADSIANDLREHTAAQLIGQHVGSPEDLAALASIYRNPAFETMRYVYVDRAGNVLGETAVSSRMPSTTHAFPTGTESGAAWVHENAPDGATGVWLIHNHPTGDPTASQGDIRVTQSLAIRLGDMAGAPKLQGHVILDHNTFGHIDAFGDWKGVQHLEGAPDIDPTRYGRGDFEMFGEKVTSPDFAATTGKRIAAATPEDSSAIVVMDAKGRVTSVHTFPNDFLVTPRGAAMVSRLGAKRGAVGIGLVTSTSNFAKHREAFSQGAARGLFRDALVVGPDGRPLTLNDTDFFPREQRKNYGQQSAGARARSSGGVQAYENAPETSAPMVSLSTVRRALADRGMTKDQIKAMTPEQLRAEQANMRRRSPAPPEEVSAGSATSIKDATVTEERAMKGKAAVEHDLSRSNPEAFAEAKRRLTADPQYGTKLAQSLVERPRPHTQEEVMALALDRMRIINERRAAYDGVQEAHKAGDDNQEAGARTQVKLLDSQMEANDRAAEMSGHETGAALQARRTMVKDDYTMATLVSRGKQAAGGELKDAQREALEKRALEIEAREKALAEREAALQNARREPRAPKERMAAKSQFDSLAEKLKAIAQKDQMKPGCVV